MPRDQPVEHVRGEVVGANGRERAVAPADRRADGIDDQRFGHASTVPLEPPQHVDGRRLAEDEAASARGRSRVEPEARQPLQHPLDRDLRLQPGEVHAEADVRPLGERDLEVERSGGSHVEAVGIVEDRRVPVRAGERDA